MTLVVGRILSGSCTEPRLIFFNGTVAEITEQVGLGGPPSIFEMYVDGGTGRCQDSRQFYYSEDTPVYAWSESARMVKVPASAIRVGQVVTVGTDPNSSSESSCPGGYGANSVTISPR